MQVLGGEAPLRSTEISLPTILSDKWMVKMIDGGLRKLFQKHLPGPHYQSIETGLTGAGVPDLNAVHRGVEVWIEMKKTHAWAVDIEPEQIGWAEQRIRAGGRVYLAVRRYHSGGPKKGAAVDELWLFSGSDTRHVRQHGLTNASPLLVERGGPSSWNWSSVHRKIFGRQIS